MHNYLSTLFWWNVGKYGGILAVLGVSWLSRQRWLPHRHDGYVAMSGYVRKCSRCGRLPEIPDPVTCPSCGDVRGSDKGWSWEAARDRTTDLCPACYLAELDTPTAYSCAACGRDDVAEHTMRDGMCARCRMVRKVAELDKPGFHYAHRAGSWLVDRHYDGEPCDCPTVADPHPDAHLWERTAYGRGHGFHYARVRSTDGMERHYDVDPPCECPNAAEYASG